MYIYIYSFTASMELKTDSAVNHDLSMHVYIY